MKRWPSILIATPCLLLNCLSTYESLYSNTWLLTGDLNNTEMQLLAEQYGFTVIDQVGTVYEIIIQSNIAIICYFLEHCATVLMPYKAVVLNAFSVFIKRMFYKSRKFISSAFSVLAICPF